MLVKETFLSAVLSIINNEKDYICFGNKEIEAHDGLDFIEGLPSMKLIENNKIGLGVDGSDPYYFKVVEITEDQISVISEISKAFQQVGINTNNF